MRGYLAAGAAVALSMTATVATHNPGSTHTEAGQPVEVATLDRVYPTPGPATPGFDRVTTDTPDALADGPAVIDSPEDFGELIEVAAERAVPERVERWRPVAEQCATGAATAPVMLGLIWSESSGDPSAVSSAGAVGLTQLMPATARSLGADPWDPTENVCGGATYLDQQHDRFGDLRTALVAYNAGPARASSGSAPQSSHRYADRTIARARAAGGGTTPTNTRTPPPAAPPPYAATQAEQVFPPPPPGGGYVWDGRILRVVPWNSDRWGDISPAACAESLLRLGCDMRGILSSQDVGYLCEVMTRPGFYMQYYADNRLEELTGMGGRYACSEYFARLRAESRPGWTG